MIRAMKWFGLAVTVMSLTAGARVKAGQVFTFDSSADLTDNFNLDVISGDNYTVWRSGYSAVDGFPGSDGGFVDFNDYRSSNSIAFKAGPVTLNSFDISSQYYAGGYGVVEAINAQLDYHLRLYDQNLSVLLDEIRTVDPTGAWTTLTFNTPNVYAIWIGRRDNDGTGTGGWWPNIDNVRVNDLTAVPEPTTLVPAILAALVGLGYGWSQRRRGRVALAINR